MDTMAEALLRSIRWPREDNKFPREILTDTDLFRLEMDAVFTGPVWVLVGHESEVPQPGDYKTIAVGAVPVIVVRGEAGRIGVLVNACAHRGTRLVEGPAGNVRRGGFRCIYHMWTYDTEGRLTAVSLPQDFPEEFRKEDYGLARARVETQVDGSPRLLAVGESRDVVAFVAGEPKLRSKTVILDTPVLQGVFVYPL